MSPGFSRCSCSPELSQISAPERQHHHSLHSGDPEPSASSPPRVSLCSPSADPPNCECASSSCTAVSLSPHPSQHTQAHMYTHMCTYTCTCIHMCTCTGMHRLMCVHARTCTHTSKPPPFKSQLKCQEKQESLHETLCSDLGWISLFQALTALCGFLCSPDHIWIKCFSGKILFNICLSHQDLVYQVHNILKMETLIPPWTSNHQDSAFNS